VKAIYESHRPSKAATRRGAKKIWFDLRRAFVEAVKELPGNVSNIGWMDREDMELLEETGPLLEELKAHNGKYLEDEEDDEPDSPDIDGFDHGVRIPDVLGPVDTMSTE